MSSAQPKTFLPPISFQLLDPAPLKQGLVTERVTCLGGAVAFQSPGRRRGAGRLGSNCLSLPSCHMSGLAMAFRGLKVPWMVLIGAEHQPEPLVGTPASEGPRLQREPAILGPKRWDPPGPQKLLASPSNMMSGKR